MSITERLQLYVTHVGISINQMADGCGVNRATLHKALRTGRGLHSDTIVAVLTAHPLLSADWLLLGHGAMIRKHPRLLVGNQSGHDSGGMPYMSEAEATLRRATKAQDAMARAETAKTMMLEALMTPERLKRLIRLLDQQAPQSDDDDE